VDSTTVVLGILQCEEEEGVKKGYSNCYKWIVCVLGYSVKKGAYPPFNSNSIIQPKMYA
jgi:hypothetical protein